MAVVGEQIGRSDPSPTPIIQCIKAIVNGFSLTLFDNFGAKPQPMGLLFLVV